MAENSRAGVKQQDHFRIKSSLQQLFDLNKLTGFVPSIDEAINNLLDGYERRKDRVELVLDTLVDEILAFGKNNQKKESGEPEQGCSSMGCGSSYGPSFANSSGAQDSALSMVCDMCQAKFSVIKFKKTCSECGVHFCGSCLPKEPGCKNRTCSRCKILEKKPPLRAELVNLRVKDLQNYLVRKKVNIKSCVEKKDLVELVLQTSDCQPESSRSGVRGSRSWDDASIRVSDQVPLERQSDFPKSYVESSHRREWFEKFDQPESVSGSDSEQGPESATSPSQHCDNSPEVTETPVEAVEPPAPEEEPTPVMDFSVDREAPDPEQSDKHSDVGKTETDTSPDSESDSTQPRAESDSEQSQSVGMDIMSEEGAVGGIIVQDLSQQEDQANQDVKSTDEFEAAGDEIPAEVKRRKEDTEELSSSVPHMENLHVKKKLTEQGGHSLPASPRRFANQGVVYLSEIQSLDDLKELSAKQAKEILAMNRVNFKGCVEKEELLKIVERLWKQEMKDKDELEKMDDDSLCKICMDAPIDCVMLECGHMCTCTNCGKQMAECPICRQYVVRVVRTFKA